MDAIEILRRLFSDWAGLSPKEIEDFFHADAKYRNVCADRSLDGASSIAGAMEVYRARFDQIESEIVRAASDGATVLLERIERMSLPNGRMVEFSGMANVTFEKGRILTWNDYFDLATLRQQVDLTEA